MNGYSITNAYGLKKGEKVILRNIYRDIKLYDGIPYAIISEEEGKQVFLLEERRFTTTTKTKKKCYDDIEFFRDDFHHTISRTDLLAIQNSCKEWGILDPLTGNEIEPMLNIAKPQPTHYKSIFIMSDANGMYFKDIYTKEVYNEERFCEVTPVTRNLYRVGIAGVGCGIYDIEKKCYAVEANYMCGPTGIRLHPNSDLAIVREVHRVEKSALLIRQYTHEVLCKGKEIDFDYTDRSTAIILDGERITIK